MTRARPTPFRRRRLRTAALIAALLAFAAPACTRSTGETIGAVAVGTGGAVASADPDATAAGLDVLRAGGSAADAAIAMALVLAVVHPHWGNLGGGGFAVARFDDEVTALDFRETAPGAAAPSMFLDAGGSAVPDSSWIGPLAAGVPGTPDGLYALHRRHGSLPWPELVEPAIRLARDGFTISARLHEAIEWSREELARFEESAAIWLPDGVPPSVGSRMVLPDLARTLRRYADGGPPGITSGPVARAIIAASKRYGGVLTLEDLAGYRAEWRQPVRISAFGWEIASMPLPSSGGIILGETFGMLERLGWSALPRASADRAHLLAEVWRRAYADRFLLGDPGTTEAKSADLLDPAWLDARAAGIERTAASRSEDVAPWSRARAPEPAETTHLSAVDAQGNLVALTTTLNGWFGCYLYIPGAGFMLNNEMDDFATVPGEPNAFGLVQGEANAIRPGRRSLSSMAPTIAWRNGEAIALGSRGGSRIPTTAAQVLLNRIVDGDSLAQAVRRPRLHHQWLPDELRYEEGSLSHGLRAALEQRGHRLKEVGGLGEVHAVRLRADGWMEAATDDEGRGAGAAGALLRPPSP